MCDLDSGQDDKLATWRTGKGIAPRGDSTGLLLLALSVTHCVTLAKPIPLSGPPLSASANDDGAGGQLFLSAYFLQALF